MKRRQAVFGYGRHEQCMIRGGDSSDMVRVRAGKISIAVMCAVWFFVAGVHCASAAGKPATTAETAAILAGLDAAPKSLDTAAQARVGPFARDIAKAWAGYQKRIGIPMKAWSCTELDAVAGETVFYPFSGPDFATVQQLYPAAGRFVLLAIQRAGPPPDVAHYPAQKLAGFLSAFRERWRFFTTTGFFRTNDLDADGKQAESGLGITTELMAFAASLGYTVDAVEPVQINADGAELAVLPADAADHGAWNSVRLTLSRGGRKVLLDYVRLDLSDGYLRRHGASRNWVERMAGNRTVLKAASHLLQKPYFSILRQALLARAPSVWQDETGLDYEALKTAFNVTLYGKFSKPHRLFEQSWQRPLALAYQESANVKPLPYRAGYEKQSGSSVIVAVRGKPSADRRAQCPRPLLKCHPIIRGADIFTGLADMRQSGARHGCRHRWRLPHQCVAQIVSPA